MRVLNTGSDVEEAVADALVSFCGDNKVVFLYSYALLYYFQFDY